MRDLSAFLHLSDDTALWLCWGSVVLSVFIPVSDLRLTVLLLGLGGGLASRLTACKKWLGWLGLLPALYAFRLCGTVGDRLLTLPPVVYLSLCILREKTGPDANELGYRFSLRVGLTFLGALFSVIDGQSWSFQCAVISICIEVFLQRLLRHSPEERSDRRLLGLELTQMGLLLGLCMIISSPAFIHAGLMLLKWLYFLLLEPVLEAVFYVVFLILWCITWLVKWMMSDPVPLPMAEFMQSAPMAAPMLEEAETAAVHPLLQFLLRLLAAAAFLVLAWRVFRWLRGGSGSWTATEVTERISAAELSPEEEDDRPGLLDRSPEARIRRAYAVWCRHLIREGHHIRPWSTTRSVSHMAGADNAPAAAELRSLYLLARYSSASDLTQSDAKRAAALSKQLRGK